ncbi:MAG: O-antigen ligase family protein [Clostridiaceae bacterium]
MENKRGDKIGSVLFFCIVFSLFPVLITSLISSAFIASSLYSILVGMVFLIQSVILFFYFWMWKQKPVDKKLFIMAWLFMISQTMTLLISSVNGLKIESFDFINVFARFISFFIFVSIPYKYNISKKGIERFMCYIVMFGFIACLYNMVVNFSGLKNILNISNPYAVDFKSFYLGRNGFAQLLFFSTVANTFLFFKRRSFYNWVCYILFAFNIFATLSRTVTASVGLFLLIFCLIYYRKKLLSKIILIIFAIIFIFTIASNATISGFIVNMLIRSDVGTSGRSDLWRTAIEMLNQNNWFFGIGYITSSTLLNNMCNLDQFHNFYIETLVGGGLIDLLLHVIVFKFVSGNIKRIYKNDRTAGIVFTSSFTVMFFYAFFESISFFSIGYVDSIFRIFFITVPLLYSNNFKEVSKKSQRSLIMRLHK